MTIAFNEQWLDLNAERAYPLVDGVSRLDLTGQFEMPNSLIVDARLSAPPSYDRTRFYVSMISAFGSGLIITFGIQGVGDVANATIPLGNFVANTAYTITGLPSYGTISGLVVVGDGASLVASAGGVYTFGVAATRLLPTVIFPSSSSVTSITLRDSFGVDRKLVGDVVFVAGENASLSVAGQNLTIGMQTGVLIEDPCACKDTGGRNRVAIRSINGVTPDSTGNVELVPVGCVSLTASDSQLKLSDSCASPCCGTPEVSLLADAAKNIQQYLSTLANGSAKLEAALRQVQDYLVQ